ncbi:MAG: hypothetical protein WC027_00795 [Candidatus Paceibacterota bacterium]
MDQETEKIIAEQMKKLPKDVIAAIISVDYKTKLQEITKAQKLLIDQAGKLEMETTLVMIGLEPLADYVANLQRELGVARVKAQEVATMVSENIFKPIRDSLYAMNNGEVEEKVEEKIIRATDSNDSNLNRDQILNEIEDPSLIGKSGVTKFTPAVKEETTTAIETLAEVPYQQDIQAPKASLLETKMAGITITSQQKVQAEPAYKLPETEKKKPFGGVDPYREEIK